MCPNMCVDRICWSEMGMGMLGLGVSGGQQQVAGDQDVRVHISVSVELWLLLAEGSSRPQMLNLRALPSFPPVLPWVGGPPMGHHPT